MYGSYDEIEDYAVNVIKQARESGYFIYFPEIKCTRTNEYTVKFFVEHDRPVVDKFLHEHGKAWITWFHGVGSHDYDRLEKEAYREVIKENK